MFTDFRPIDSGTTGSRLTEQHKEFPADWFEGLDIKKQVTRAWGSYDTVSLRQHPAAPFFPPLRRFGSGKLLTYNDRCEWRQSVNKYNCKCGGTLDMWESSGWISPQDPCKHTVSYKFP